MRSLFLPGAGLALLLAAGCQSTPQSSESAGRADSTATRTTGLAATATAAGSYVRKNCNSPAAKADLDALAKALAIMKKLPCDDPRGWYYQGAIHNVPGDIAHNPYCAQFTSGGAPLAGWDGCTHGGGENHFLIWHRLFTLHFERIVRKLSGKADFAMPYWDYTNTQAGYRVMPAIFRSRTDSLYEGARYQPLNGGQAIDPSMNAALDTALINQYRSFSLFNTNIDQAPHGAMHDYIGCGNLDAPVWNRIYQQSVPGGLMGNVPSAAFDPIFWVHHANIDYLWAAWARSSRGQAPNLAALEANPWKYQFFDENGKSVTYTVAQAYDAALHPDYRYDVLPAPGEKMLGAPAPTQETAPVLLASAAVGKAVVGSTKFSARLAVATRQQGLLKSATPRPPAAGGQRLLLQVEVSLAKEPRGFYEVYVRNQGGTGLLTTRPQLAGILNFFGVSHQHGAGHADMPGMSMPADKLRKTFTFDVTDEVNAASFAGGLDVQVVPKGAGTVPITIEKLTLLTQAR